MNYLPLLGILIIVLGFALRFNPMVVVPVAAIATGLLAGLDLAEVISKLGKAFNDSRLIAVPWIVLPVIGLLERYGLQQRARAVIAGFRAATAGRLLILYLVYRQGISAIGLHSTAGHAQTVRPLVAPMAVAAAEARHGPLDEATSDKVKAYAAATDNVGLFFGEDIFFAIGSIILIQQTLESYGIPLSPLELAVWAIPTAIAAFIVHSTRLILLDRSLAAPRRRPGAMWRGPMWPRAFAGERGGRSMITGQHVLFLVGAMFAAFAMLSAFDRTNPKRFGNAVFWGLFALSLIAGSWLGDFANGCIVLALAALAGFKRIGRGASETSEAQRSAAGERYGNALFLPILIVLVIAVTGTLLYLYTPLYETGLFEKNRETFVLLCAGVLIALAMIFAWLKPPPLAPLQEGRRLIDAVGWAVVLPMMLAALGLVLAETGVGRTIGGLVLTVIPEGTVLPAVIAFGLGMALFTILTGNAFAAFPVMATAIGVPLLIQTYHGDPAVIGAIGMLAGFCGTLMTPMAANFNLVPAALLELKDPNGVIKAQIGTALPLLAINILFIYFLAF